MIRFIRFVEIVSINNKLYRIFILLTFECNKEYDLSTNGTTDGTIGANHRVV